MGTTKPEDSRVSSELKMRSQSSMLAAAHGGVGRTSQVVRVLAVALSLGPVAVTPRRPPIEWLRTATASSATFLPTVVFSVATGRGGPSGRVRRR